MSTTTSTGQGKGVEKEANSGEPWISVEGGPSAVLEEVRRLVASRPGLRPTAKVVAVLEPGTRREQIVGVLQMQQQHSYRPVQGPSTGQAPLFLIPMDPR